jgi:hypothetical protein
MKTPMQELIEHLEKWMLDDKHVQDNPMKYEEYMVQHANQMVSVKRDFVILCESLLEKEKEMMVDFAYNCRNLMAADEFAITHWYDKTFNTKEK